MWMCVWLCCPLTKWQHVQHPFHPRWLGQALATPLPWKGLSRFEKMDGCFINTFSWRPWMYRRPGHAIVLMWDTSINKSRPTWQKKRKHTHTHTHKKAMIKKRIRCFSFPLWVDFYIHDGKTEDEFIWKISYFTIDFEMMQMGAWPIYSLLQCLNSHLNS